MLTSGCKIEKRELGDTEALLKCMAFDAATAWHLFDLHRRTKLKPDVSAQEVIEPDEIVTCQLPRDLYPKIPIRAPLEGAYRKRLNLDDNAEYSVVPSGGILQSHTSTVLPGRFQIRDRMTNEHTSRKSCFSKSPH